MAMALQGALWITTLCLPLVCGDFILILFTYFMNKDFSMPLIFPGTKYCGVGHKPYNNSDLGVFTCTDLCCVEHDKCPDTIGAGEKKGRIVNNCIMGRLSCQCDVDFDHCLEKCKTLDSMFVKNIYFDIIGFRCFAETCPYSKTINELFCPSRCEAYTTDNNTQPLETPTYQWCANSANPSSTSIACNLRV